MSGIRHMDSEVAVIKEARLKELNEELAKEAEAAKKREEEAEKAEKAEAKEKVIPSRTFVSVEFY